MNIEFRSVASLRSIIHIIDRVPYFDIRYSLFDILRFPTLKAHAFPFLCG